MHMGYDNECFAAAVLSLAVKGHLRIQQDAGLLGLGKKFTLVKDKMTMEMANGEPWQLTGQFIEKNYTVTSGGRDVVRITQKWVTIKDKYTVDVADGADPGLAFAIVWAVDRWVERD